MGLVWRLIREMLAKHKRAVFARVLIAAAVAATPYAFSFLGKWLVDEALQVTGPPAAEVAADEAEAGVIEENEPAETAPLALEWRARTTEEKLRLLVIFLVISLGIHVGVTVFSGLSELLNARMVHGMVFDLRTRLQAKLSDLELGLFHREQVGQLMTRTLDDTGQIPAHLCNLVINTCTHILMLVLGAVLLLGLNPRMAFIVLGALPFYAVACIYFLPRLRSNAEALRDRLAAFNGYLVERLSNILTIKNYAQEGRETAAVGRRIADFQVLSQRQHRLNLYFDTSRTLITGFSTLAVLTLGFLNIRAQRMQLGEVLAFWQVTAQLFVPISALVGMATVAQTLRVLGERVYTILDAEETLRDGPDAIDIPELQGHVRFENVSLRYTAGGPFAVRNVTLDIPADSTVCLVGPTGCGKSTLIALLTRLYDPTEGSVRLDGVDIRSFRVSGLRRAVGNVLRECKVFSGTIAENIRFGRPDASQDEVEQAAESVGLHDLILTLHDGYDTRVGPGGMDLTSGWLTRIAVARALLTRPAVVTIDDTFSSLDEEAEHQLHRAVRSAAAGRTVLIATSRLDLCAEADMVVVMQKGTIEQIGKHHDLLAVPGVYRRMYMLQMGIDEIVEDENR